MFSWTLRIAGWIIGIYALLKLAAATGSVTYTTVFQAWLDQLRDILDLGFILKPLTQAVILPALDLIRSFGIPIPALQDHWQQVFVLMWLFVAAFARNSDALPTPVGLLVAFVGTLPWCVATGTVPLGSLAVILWPIAGVLASSAIEKLLNGEWQSALLYAALAAACAAIGYLIPSGYGFYATAGVFVVAAIIGLRVDFGMAIMFAIFAAAFAAWGYFNGTGPLMMLAVMIASVGLFALVIVPIIAEGALWQRLQDPDAAIGLDITAAMLGAFGLATAFADPPLF